MYTIHGIIMNLCSCKPLMGTGSEKLFNTQTANYGVDFVNWVGPSLEWECDKVGRFMKQHSTYARLEEAHVLTVFTRTDMREM